MGKFDGVNSEGRQRNYGRHGQARSKDAFALLPVRSFGQSGLRRVIQCGATFVCDESGGPEPQERSDQRKIVETPRVIDLEVDGHVDHQRREHMQ